ncbi:DUF2206 domain-containing protein [Methanocaldococcus sp. 28A]
MLSLNEWGFKKFVIISLSLLLVFDGLIILDEIGLNIPIIRQVTGFLFLTFIPGYTILRILRINKIDRIEALLFATGLSLLYIMIIGLFMDIFYPMIGIKRPISLIPLLITFNITFILFLILAYFKDKTYINNKNNMNLILFKDILNPYVLGLLILPILGIGSAYFFNITGDSSLIMLTFLLIIIIPIYVIYSKKTRYLTWTIWILTISLLYVSDFGTSWNYIWGYDINGEYYLAHLVLTHGYWDPNVVLNNYNSVLSVVLLNPIYSIFLNLSQIMVFKIIYPLIFSLVPVGLYRTYCYFLRKKESFLATFFFISLSTFFIEMLAVARQQIAELYLMLLILLIFTRNLNYNTKKIFLIMFGFGLVISHYGTVWLFIISLIIGWIVYSILYPEEKKELLLNGRCIIIFIIITLLYHILVSRSSVFDTIVQTGNIILNSIYDVFTPKAQGFYFIIRHLSLLHNIGKYIYLITQGFIGIGILWLFFNYKKTKINKEYVALTFVWFAYDVAGIVVPYFANALNASRLYQLTLFFLAPFEVIGYIAVFRFLQKVTKIQLNNQVILKFFTVFLVIYLVFTSGLIYKVANDPPYPGYLGKEVSCARWTNSEIMAGLWIKEYKNNNSIYADFDRVPLFLGLLGQSVDNHMLLINSENNIVQPKKTSYGYYLFLGSWNIENKKLNFMVIPIGRGQKEELPIKTPEIFNMLLHSNKIYSSQNAQYYIFTSS